MKVAEGAVAMLGTLSLVLLVFVAGNLVFTAWAALIGSVVWLVAFLSVLLCEPNRTAVVMMAVGSVAILVAHLDHACRLFFRRTARLLRNSQARVPTRRP